MIPKKIHYCWFGDKPIPDNYKKFIEGWRALMPDYEIVLWNEENSPMEEKYLKRAYANKKWANLSNYVRLHAVHQEGGIYLDTDVEVVKSFDPLLNHSCFFGYQVSSHESVNNAVFGAEKNHWFIKSQLEAIKLLYDGLETEYLSSPHLTTYLLRENAYLSPSAEVPDKELRVFPYTWFYPYSWMEPYTPECVTEDTYTIHHWSGTWAITKEKKKASVLKSIRNLIR